MKIPPVPAQMNRIAILGSTASGKTTLARALSDHFGAPHIELDALRFLPGWQVRDNDEFRALVDQATRSARWICDGNYSIAREFIWGRADTLIWLDYRLSLILWRLTRRTLGRSIRRTDLWNTGNRENVLKHFQFSDDSLYYWVFKTYWRRKRNLPAEFARPENAHLRVVHLTHPRMTAKWLDAVRAQSRQV